MAVQNFYKKIVIPLDGSPLAEVALPYAEEVAGKMESEIVLLTVLPSEEPNEYLNYQNYIRKIVDITKRQVDKYAENKANESTNVGTATRAGNPAEGILDYIEKGNMCLIVMATHGRSGVGRWAVGSVADKVVRATTRQPLMLIRAKGAHPDVRAKRILKKALIPLDGSATSEAVIPYFSEIAQRLRMDLTLLRVIPKNNGSTASADTYLDNWCRQLADKGINVKHEVRAGSPADQIIDLADELASDLVVMSTRGQTGVNLWSLGSVAQKVLLGGNTPLLLIRA
jgi:nucleotide-binding universal stress UspA family protein